MNKSSQIINIASVVGQSGNPGQANYVYTKAGIIGLTKCLSNEWAPRGVTVNCVAPGFIQTNMLQLKDPETIIGRIPVGRLGVPEDVTGAVRFLVSDQARYITGSTIVVDGGWLAR